MYLVRNTDGTDIQHYEDKYEAAICAESFAFTTRQNYSVFKKTGSNTWDLIDIYRGK